jgi:plasmid maintenance system antidote protein VapI
MGKLKPVTPGELLLEEFLIPMGLSQYRQGLGD